MKKFFILKNLFISIILICSCIVSGVRAQGTKITTAFDSAGIIIGDQIYFNIKVEQFKDAHVTFPLLNDSLSDKIEIISASKPDTAFVGNDRIAVIQKYLITSFDSGIHKVKPLQFVVHELNQTDTLRSDTAYLGVGTFVIKDPKKIADIKNVIDIPITFAEILPYILVGLGVLLLIALIAYIVMRLKQNKPIFGMFEKPVEPPHIIAFRELELIKNEKLWQQGLSKQYFTRITDVVRIYIENRFSVPALESTTEEILVLLKNIETVDSKLFEQLKQMLALADFVKFAKAEPMPEENETSWQTAYAFVKQTMYQNEVEEQEPVKE